MLAEGLVDVVGVSLKGLTPQQAESVSGVRREVSWGRVMETIALSEGAGVPFILTYVAASNADFGEAFDALGALLRTYGNLRLKVNNLQPNPRSRAEGLAPVDEDELRMRVSEFAGRDGRFGGRVIYIPNSQGIIDEGFIERFRQ